MLGANHNKRRRGNLAALVFSLLLHAGLFLVRENHTASFEKSLPPKETLIELSQVPPELIKRSTIPETKEDRQQVVETEDAGNREIDPQATLLSDRNQKASQNTKAFLTDDFRKGMGRGQNPESPNQGDGIPPEGDPQSQDALHGDDISTGTEQSLPAQRQKGVKRNWKTLSLKDLSVGDSDGPSSASDDFLPHVDSGERTILSTREFRYFSYYNRIKDLLRQFWKPSIEREVAKLWGKGQMLKENELTTRVLVLLDKQGKIQKISKVGASGITEIDEAAVQAFYQAAPFPNPPAGLIDGDGFVRINWDFILQTASAPRIQYRPSGPRAFR